MIGWIEGQILEKFDDNKIILVNKNIGYIIKLLNTEFVNCIGQYSFYISQIISENKNDLYGFETVEELDIFNMLIKISGIGPSTASTIMENIPMKKISISIKSGDITIFKNTKGIGPKSLIRIKETLIKINRGKTK